MAGVHQFVPLLHRGDAVGEHTLAVRDALRRRGVTSEIYVELDDPETSAETRPADRYPEEAVPGDVLCYQFATASKLADWLVARDETLAVNYHNVTPAPFFAPWDEALAQHQVWAQLQLGELGRRSALGVAVSEVNRADLVAAGFGRTEVVPPVVTGLPEPGRSHPPARTEGSRWLAVGRLAPNKAVEHAVAALLATRWRLDPGAELTVVGRAVVAPYAEAVRAFAAELGVERAVHLVGRVDDGGLDRAYEEADVLVVTSEHEGFCLPVVEAMARDLPVVAYREGALPEVLGEGGVLVDDKDPWHLARAIDRLRTDPAHRAEVVARGRDQLARLDLGRAADRLVDLLVTLA